MIGKARARIGEKPLVKPTYFDIFFAHLFILIKEYELSTYVSVPRVLFRYPSLKNYYSETSSNMAAALPCLRVPSEAEL